MKFLTQILAKAGIIAPHFQADTTNPSTGNVGRLIWNNTDGTLDLGLKGGNVTLQLGQEQVQRVVNKSGAALNEAAYQVVKVTDAQGQRLAVDLAQGNNDANSTDTLGVVTETIAQNQEGFITTSGLVREINTTGSLQGETWIDGDVLYLSPTIAGAITKVKPTAPNHSVILGYVVYAHAIHGKIFVKCDNGYEIGELHDVYVPTPSNNDGIFWNTANNRYQNNSVIGALGYTPVNQTRLLTINGTSYNLSADRTWSIDLDSVTDVNSVTTNKITVGGVGLTGMTAGSGALYYNAAANRVTVANYNAGGSVYMEVNGGSYSAIFHPDLMFESLGAIKGVFTAATTDTDRFLVSDGGVVKYRTGSQILSDIGGQNSISLTTNGYSGASTFSSNVLNIPNYGAVDDGVISGGIVTWTGTGLVFNVSACNYYINGVNYTSPLTSITLDAADPTFDRIDVFAVNTSGQVVVIKGTPSSNPVEPEGDTTTTIGLTNVTVTAGSTTPNQAVRNLIYDENVETWTQAIAGGTGFSYNNVDTTQFYSFTKSFKVIQGSQYAQLRFSKAVAMDIRDYKSLSFAIRLDTAWTNQTFQISFYNGTTRTALYTIGNTNVVGFNRSLANEWQFVTLNLALFSFNSNAFTGVQIFTSGSNRTYWIDTVSLNGGINNPTGNVSNSFGFVNGSTGSASATIATDTLSIVGTGLATTSATGKTLTIAVPTPIPSQTGNTGKFLTTNGSAVSWASVDALPSQSGNIGKYLTTNGSTASWATVDALPSQTGNNGKYLTTDGTSASWVTVSTSNIYNSDGTLTSNRTLTLGGYSLTFTGSRTASSAIARGLHLKNTLVAAANNDVLVGLDIQPTFTLGAFTGTNSIAAFIRSGKIVSGASTASFASGSIEVTDVGYYSPITISNSTASYRGVVVGANAANHIVLGFGGTTAPSPMTNRALLASLGSRDIIITSGSSAQPALADITMTLFGATRNVGIGTGVTDGGYKLDVNGTARVNGTMTVTRINTDGLANLNNFSGAFNVIELRGSSSQYIYDGAAWRWRETATTGYFKVGSGSVSINAIPYNSTGVSNVAIGNGTGGTGAASYMTALGEQALTSLTSGANNTSVGHASLYNVTTGANNTAIGRYAGISTGSNANANHSASIFIGVGNGWSTGGTALTNTYIIGNDVRTDLSNVFMLGKSNQTIMIGQGTSVGSGAIMQIDSTTKGFLPPRMTLAQRTAIVTPAIGLLVYQTDTTEGVYQYTSLGWTLIGSGGGGGGVGSDLFNFYNFI